MSKRTRMRQCRNSKMPVDLTNELLNRLQRLHPDVKSRYLVSEVVTKFVSADTDPAPVRKQRAINKWLATERENEATNERLLITSEEYNILPRVSFGSFVQWCRDTVARTLGETVPIEVLIGSFSGGASTSRNRTISHPAGKYLGRAHITKEALSVFSSLTAEVPIWSSWSNPEQKLTLTEAIRSYHPSSIGGMNDKFQLADTLKDLVHHHKWHGYDFEVVPGNVMFTVPKKTDIDRAACKEPDINMFMQKGVGDFIRKRLKTCHNIDLNDQSRNRLFARIGSIDGSLATLDLSSASDSVSRGLVELLLPPCWFTLLDSIRSQVTILPDGEMHRNEMFSSMGNGFTFELESLLFYVLTRATAYFTGRPGIVSVYGDDIICPSKLAPDLTWVLGYFGFTVNTEKSFSEGPFRESCGGHYYNGLDITPFYVKKPIETLLDVIDVANKLRKWAQCDSGLPILHPEVDEIWLWLKSMVPSCLWGGEDLNSKYQLVSNDESHSRLVENTRKGDAGEGAYLHWLNTTWRRATLGEAVETSSKTNNLGSYRIRKLRVSTVPRLNHYFYHEVMTPPSPSAI